MASEPLKIKNRTFLVNRLIEQAPKQTFVREFFKNADENAALGPEGDRRIEIYPIEIAGVRKLAFFNTGVGMNATELRSATDLSSSLNKTMALDENFGIGAKVSGLAVSPAGIRYRSCKNGKVKEVVIGYDGAVGSYVRFGRVGSDKKSKTVYDVSADVRAEGYDLSYDWTEVVLMGEDAGHDMVAQPLGRNKAVDRSFLATSIFRRFSSTCSGARVYIDPSMIRRGAQQGEADQSMKFWSDIVGHLPRAERVVTSDPNVSVRFVHDLIEGARNKSAALQKWAASSSFCALVHKGERYEFKNRRAWECLAPEFGMAFGARVLSVEIELADGAALPNQYRDGLIKPDDRAPIRLEDYAALVRAAMPDWVREIISAEAPRCEDRLDDLRADLQQLLDGFQIPLLPSEITSDNRAPSDDYSFIQDVSSDRQPLHPDHVKRSTVKVPDIQILTEPDAVMDKNLKGRAGKFYKESQMIFINGLYPSVDVMAQSLEMEFLHKGEPELVRATCLQAARRFMAFRIGKMVCFALSKRSAQNWQSADMDRGITPEALSLAADDYGQSLDAARHWIGARLNEAALAMNGEVRVVA